MSALGGILAGLGGGGGAPEEAGMEGGGDPDALLAQIRDLMEQYVALGPETPAYDVISQAIPALDEAMGGGGLEGEMPMEEGMMPPEGADPSGGAVMPEGEENSPMMPSSPPSGFDEASAMALEDMKKRKAPR